MEWGGIMEGSQPVWKAGSQARADEEVGLLVDTLYALTRAIAAASADLRALKSFGSGAILNDAVGHSTLSTGPVHGILRRPSEDQ